MGYLWLKVVHIVAVLSWMAGLLYLPRLFVYHAGVTVGSETSELFKIMERRLVKAIMVPAAVVTWAMGIAMAVSGGIYTELWFQIKAVLVVALTATHFRLVHHKNCFAEDRNLHSARFFRILNEVPTLLMIGIVALAVLKPI